MSIAVNPPEFQFTGLVYNREWWTATAGAGGLTQDEGDALYLRKTVPDMASALETFSAGLTSSSYDLTSAATTKNLFTTQTANANLFGSMGAGTTLKLGNQTTTQSVHVSYIDCNGSTINNANAPFVGNLSIGNSQTTGQITLGGVGRSGAINIYRSFTPLFTAVPTSAEIGYNALNFATTATYTTSTTAGTVTNIAAYTNAPIGTWLYESIGFINTINAGRVSMSYNTASTTAHNTNYIISGTTTNSGVYFKLSAILQFTNSTTTVNLNADSSIVSCNIININTSRTRLA